jgi:hypothetical protein
MYTRVSAAIETRLASFVLPAAFAVACFIATFALTSQPTSGPVAAVFPPWWSAQHALRAAAAVGAVIRVGAFGFVVVVDPDTSAHAVTLFQVGAWLVLDPRALGCSSISQKSSDLLNA